MSTPSYRLAPFGPGLDLTGFDCGEEAYNAWLFNAAAQAHKTGSAHVSVLERDDSGGERVVGYFAVCPTLVVRDQMPKPMQRRMLRSTPGWLLAKLAVDNSLRSQPEQWGRQLLREALLAIIAAAERGGGAVIVVDAGNAGLVPFYERNGFTSTGGTDLRLFMKVATARAYLLQNDLG
ncbi:N-acetyltransferase [Jatrophihabitans sp.]|uniref:N-acetyltransferase n=1 Tax=Jatrophihabitans sp. TaxID=1932789 RepID=UPI002F077FCF